MLLASKITFTLIATKTQRQSKLSTKQKVQHNTLYLLSAWSLIPGFSHKAKNTLVGLMFEQNKNYYESSCLNSNVAWAQVWAPGMGFQYGP